MIIAHIWYIIFIRTEIVFIYKLNVKSVNEWERQRENEIENSKLTGFGNGKVMCVGKHNTPLNQIMLFHTNIDGRGSATAFTLCELNVLLYLYLYVSVMKITWSLHFEGYQ